MAQIDPCYNVIFFYYQLTTSLIENHTISCLCDGVTFSPRFLQGSIHNKMGPFPNASSSPFNPPFLGFGLKIKIACVKQVLVHFCGPQITHCLHVLAQHLINLMLECGHSLPFLVYLGQVSTQCVMQKKLFGNEFFDYINRLTKQVQILCHIGVNTKIYTYAVSLSLVKLKRVI